MISILGRHKAITAVLLFVAVLNGVGITWGLPESWAIDSPYLGYLWATDQLDANGFKDPVAARTALILIGRSVSVLMGVGIALLAYRIAGRLTGEPAGLLAALFVGCSAQNVFYAKTANVDLPYLFWTMFCLYYALLALDTGRMWHFVAAGLTAALAISTKDQAVAPVIGIALSTMLFHYLGTTRSLAALFDQKMRYAALTFVVAFLIAGNILLRPGDFVSHLGFVSGPAFKPFSNIEPSLIGWIFGIGLMVQETAILIGWLPVGLMAVGIGRLVATKQWRPLVFFIMPMLGTMELLLVTSRTRERYMLSIIAMVGLLAAIGGARLLAGSGVRKALGVGGVGCSVLAVILAGVKVDLALINDPRDEVTQWVTDHVRPDEKVLIYGYRILSPILPDSIERVTIRVPENLPTDFAQHDPDYVILVEDFLSMAGQSQSDSREPQPVLHAGAADFMGGHLGYEMVKHFPKYRTPFGFHAEDTARNPELYLFRKKAR